MSRSCQRTMFSNPTWAFAAQHPRQAADPLADDRVLLVRHRRAALLPGRERLAGLAHLAALEVPDLGGEPVKCRAGARQAGEQCRVPVTGDDLGGDLLALEAQPVERGRLDLRVAVCIRANGSGQLAHPDAFEGGGEPLLLAAQLGRPAQQLQPERGRLGVDAVRAADGRRVTVLLCPSDDGSLEGRDPGREQLAGIPELEGERRVHYVRRRQPIVEPAGRLSHLLGDRLGEGEDVVVRAVLDLEDARDVDPRVLGDGGNGRFRHHAQLGPCLHRGNLYVQPPLEPALVRPDGAHGGSGISGDH